MAFPPAAAGRGDDPANADPRDRLDRAGNDRLEQPSRQMKAADEARDLLHTGDALGVLQDVDGARVRAAGDDHQPPIPNVDDDILVIPDPWIGLPAAVRATRLLPGKSLLEVGDSLDLARDQEHVIDQHAGTARVRNLNA